ncbi:hypothetical protein K523DRAFT_160770 [Schizophyllum commune Tattone D]|nr:hypothetical protein K523DRAFT_160770 [Schizophyllum commune Tattone D]
MQTILYNLAHHRSRQVRTTVLVSLIVQLLLQACEAVSGVQLDTACPVLCSSALHRFFDMYMKSINIATCFSDWAMHL